VNDLEINPRALSGTGEWSVTLGAGRLVFGESSIDQLGELVRELGCNSVLLVTDSGLCEAGHVERAERSLGRASIACTLFKGVVENPSSREVEEGRLAARECGSDCIVALGGGSSMDCAKGVNFVLTNGGRMDDYWGSGKATRPMLPSIGIPTTAGTGSEAQSYALISQETTGAKMACGDPKARFRTVILDPSLTSSAPREVRAVSAVDALSHAVESFVSTKRNPVSQLFSREAWRLLESSAERTLAHPDDGEARGRMLLGSYFAGHAIEHSMLGAAHACANPLTSRFGVTHGIAVGLMLPHVVRFNEIEVGDLYSELAEAAESPGPPRELDTRFCELRGAAGLPGRLRDYEIPIECLDELAEDASSQWTASFNPRPVGREDLRKLYEAAY
jgi:alcohol dehydrogenase